MSHVELLELAEQAVTLITPMIAGGALAKIGENTLDVATRTFKDIWVALQRRFAGDDEAESALRLYQAKPEASARQELLAEQIAARFASDAAALAELQALVSQLQAQAAAPPAGRTHKITVGGNAQVGQAIAGDVHGGLTVGPIDFSKKTIVAPPRASGVSQLHLPAAPAARPRLPDTLSADGERFTYGHALVIGVGTYKRDGLSVATTAADASRIGELLCDPQIAGYPTAQIRVLVDAEATRAGILGALDAFAQQLASAASATALIFFAGHGKQQGSGYYLLPHDYTPEDLAGSAISAAEFHAKIDAIRQRAQKLIMLLNCCHSGGIGDAVLDDTAGETAGDTPPADFYQPLVAGGGQVVISAARPWQKAGADSSIAPQHTLFGARLLEGLRGQAPGDAPGIGVFELFSYLSAQVPLDAKQIIYKDQPLAQEPLLYAHQLDANIAVALRPNWQGGTLDTELADTIEELAQVEIELAGYAREVEAPKNLIRRRDALLQKL